MYLSYTLPRRSASSCEIICVIQQWIQWLVYPGEKVHYNNNNNNRYFDRVTASVTKLLSMWVLYMNDI